MTTTPERKTPEQVVTDALVMTDLSDYAGTDMGMINQAVGSVIAALRAAGLLVSDPTENACDPEKAVILGGGMPVVAPTEEQIERAHAINGVREMEQAFVTSEWGTVVRKLDVIEMLRDLPAAGVAPQAHAKELPTSPGDVKNEADSFNAAPQEPSEYPYEDHLLLRDPQEPSEPTYSPASGEWSSSCPCIRAEQVDPECEWHGRSEFRRGGTHHPDTQGPSGEMVAKAARVLHIANCCNLSDSAEHQEPQNEDIYTAGVVLNSVPLDALAAQSVPDDVIERAERVVTRHLSRLSKRDDWGEDDTAISGQGAFIVRVLAEEGLLAAQPVLDAEKVAEVIEYYFDVPGDRLELITRALCEAAKRGELS